MPTGYTSKVCTGEITDFATFTLQCARAFGALIEMRDDPADAPIPDTLKPTLPTYYETALTKAEEDLKKWDAMSGAEQLAFVTQVKEDTVKSCEERVQEVKATKQRLESMLAKVRNWTPPSTDHTNLKDFMERQLVDTITWDGNVTYAEQAVELAKGLDLQQAIVRHREQLLKTIDFMRDHVDKGNVTYGQRQLWLDQLRDSLKGA